MRIAGLLQLSLGVVVVMVGAGQALATFHLMKIEQVIGGVDGDTTAQAIQLRMRTGFQNLVGPSRIRAWDAAGLNPVVVVDFTTTVTNNAAGDRILVASASFPSATVPAAAADATMANLIPVSYLAAGSLTFETDNGLIIYWRLSWGGAGYTGSNSGSSTNDLDGNFGPPFPGPLPTTGAEALLFQGPAGFGSTNNAADYALTGGAATFTNNARVDFTVTIEPSGACCDGLLGDCTDDSTQTECETLGFRYGGDDSTCETISPVCDPALPVGIEVVASGLTAPVFLTHAGDGSGRLFIVDQIGAIRIVKNGALLPTPFLDLTGVVTALGPVFDERGLLGLAFHPDYANNGRFFVRYSLQRALPEPPEWCNSPDNPFTEFFGFVFGCHEEVLAEYQVLGDPATSDAADPSSEIILFRVDEPEFNHDSGQVMFGPDGLLYWTLGGGGNDGLSLPALPHGSTGNGQDTSSVLGSVLRIDVDGTPDVGLSYKIPPDNPFAGGGGAPEIYAYGFRNPYRFSFDDGPGGDGALIVADVGQDLLEEVNVVVKGGNYGWALREGFDCFDPFATVTPPATCDVVGASGEPLLDPVMDYDHGIGIAIVGGFVYRGLSYPALTGKYVFGDFSRDFGPTGRLLYADIAGPDAWLLREFHLTPGGTPLGQAVYGVGEDEDGELYLLASDAVGPSGSSGVVYRLTPPIPSAAGVGPRYIEVTIPAGPEPIAIAVSPDCPQAGIRYAGVPVGDDNISKLGPEGSTVFLTPAEWGAKVRIGGIDIVPNSAYDVWLDVGVPGSAALSPAASATTPIWGDAVGAFVDNAWELPDNSVDITRDATAVLDGFKRLETAPPMYQMDMVGFGNFGLECDPDQQIDIIDVTSVVNGFGGFSFEDFTNCAVPCP